MTTIETNKLIAEFMGMNFSDKMSSIYIDAILKNDCNYHNDWNKLIKVVEKIEETHDAVICIHSQYTKIMLFNDNDCIWRTTQADKDTKLEATYRAVVEFLEFLKKEKV